MLIAIDIGNSNIKIGLFMEGRDKTMPEIRRISVKELLTTEQARGVEDQRMKLKEVLGDILSERPRGVIISSVVPELTQTFMELFSDFTDKVLLVNYRLDTGLIFRIPDPSKTGPDRIAGATAAYHEFKSPLVVADFGSATALTVVGKGGLYLGGAILPGVQMMAQVLHEETGLLPKIEPTLEGLEPIGKKTISAINSGIIYGTAGAIDRLRSEFEKELGHSLLLITTGGNASLIEPYIKVNHRRPYLVLEGLKIIFERNV